MRARSAALRARQAGSAPIQTARSIQTRHAPSSASTQYGVYADRLNKVFLMELLQSNQVQMPPNNYGNALMWLGVALFPRSLWMVIVSMLLYGLLYERIMLAEEAFLRRRFGERYEEWAARTPAFIPRLSSWTSPSLSSPSTTLSTSASAETHSTTTSPDRMSRSTPRSACTCTSPMS